MKNSIFNPLLFPVLFGFAFYSAALDNPNKLHPFWIVLLKTAMFAVLFALSFYIMYLL